ncbi:uncharacterized protein LOC135468836 isoform X1 [Liolophura sinensis]|uniref:uncharacterized protein LOC135468836 isoform X1 n=1 Tax=Liolophura sinensis TaxID=3198878 RepID=UPI00315993DA
MSTRRKKYSRQAKNKAERYGTSDSDTPVQDTEHQQTMRIITRLSQKYLTTRATPGSTSQSSAFTETEEEYYGDEENSPDTTGQSDGSITFPQPHDAYDFDSNEGLSNPRLILSPVKAGQLSVSCKQTKQNRKAPFTFQKAGSVKETTAKNKHKNS